MEIVQIKYFKTIKNALLLASGENELPIPKDDLDQHNFFNELVITNTTSNELLITPDNTDDRAFLITPKTSFIWKFKDDNFKYSALRYKDLSNIEIPANKIYFMIIKKRLESVQNA